MGQGVAQRELFCGGPLPCARAWCSHGRAHGIATRARVDYLPRGYTTGKHASRTIRPIFIDLGPKWVLWPNMGIWAYVKKIWSSGVSPKKASKMQLRNVDLRSVGPSVQKLWPTTFFARKMPCILHCNEKKFGHRFLD